METIKIILGTVKGFKRYQWMTFITFLITSFVALLEGEFYYSLLTLSICVWVFKVSEYRQDLEENEEGR